MKHVFWLRDGIIGGRRGPNREPWNPAELKAHGIGAVLSVNDGELVHPEDLAPVGIRHECVPLSEDAPPQPGDFEHCVAALPRALAFARQEISSGNAVLVHCNAGKDRTGMFLCYFLCQTEALPPREAIREVRRVRSFALSAVGWEEFTLDVLTELAA